jgi:hypothetical protein
MSPLLDSPARPTRIDLRLVPTLALISSTCRFVTAFYEPLVGDADVIARAARTVREMLENALDCSRDRDTSLIVELVRVGRSSVITVQVDRERVTVVAQEP